MTVNGNGGTLEVNHKATVPGYKQYFWFSKDTITNVLDIKNLIKYSWCIEKIKENQTWNSSFMNLDLIL